MTFLDYYRENLDHIRGVASEFAVEFPKIAARLELSVQNCQDPYVERLLEGAAFLAARVENKLDAGFPRLLETVLASAAPLAVCPVPSYAVLQLKPDTGDGRLRGGLSLSAGTAFRCAVDGVRTPCTYTLLADAPIANVQLADAKYLTRELLDYGLDAQAALCLSLKSLGGASVSFSDALTFYIDLPEGEASMLQGQLCGDFDGVYVRRNGKTIRLDGASVDLPTYANQPVDSAGALHGLATLQRFFAYPNLFKFVRIRGLSAIGNVESLEILVALKRREPLFFRSLGPSTLRLDCAAAVNVFERRSDRTEFRGNYECLVMPDRSAPCDYEVFRVLSLEAYDERNQVLFTACDTYGSESSDRFVPHRRDHVTQSGTARSSYHGGEVFVSLAGPGYAACHGDIRQVGMSLLCTNRDLPLLLRLETPLSPPSGVPVLSASFLAQPSRPHPPTMSGAASSDWEKLSHLTFNLSSLLWKGGTMAVGILRDLVRAYGAGFGDAAERLADGIRTLDAHPRTFRFVRSGAVYFENGWEIRINLDETTCSGSGVYTYASVLKELLFAYVPLGVCVELSVVTDKREHPYVWRS